MGNMIGADVEALQRLALQFEQSADRLRHQAGQVANGVSVSAWAGPVAVRFRTDWDSTHSVALRTAAEALSANATILRQNAAAQERASQAGASTTGTGGGGVGAGRLTAEQRARLKDLEQLVRQYGVEDPGLVIEAVTMLRDGGYLKPGQLVPKNLHDLLKMVNGLKLNDFSGAIRSLKTPGGVLGLVGAGISAHDLGVALASSDEPGAWRASLDMVAAGVGTVVPGAGIAWWVGTKTGEGIYHVAEENFHVSEMTYNSAVRQMYGRIDPSQLTPEQAQAVVERYEGFNGIFYSINDAVVGPIYGAGDALGDVIYDSHVVDHVANAVDSAGQVVNDVVDSASNAVDGAVKAAGDAMNSAGAAINEGIENIKNVRWPWQ